MIKSLKVLVTETTLWVLTVMQDIYLVVACKQALVLWGISSVSPELLNHWRVANWSTWAFLIRRKNCPVYFGFLLFAFGRAFSLLASIFLLILWQLYLLLRYFRQLTRILLHINRILSYINRILLKINIILFHNFRILLKINRILLHVNRILLKNNRILWYVNRILLTLILLLRRIHSWIWLTS